MTDLHPAVTEFRRDLPAHVAAVLEAMSDGVWVCDAEPRLLWINQACEALNDIRREDVCGRTVAELLGMGNFDHDSTSQVLRRRAPVAINQKVKSGRTLLVNAVPVLGEDGEVAFVVGTERDLTELNHLRGEIEKSREITRRISAELMALRMRDATLAGVVAESEAMERVLDTAVKLAQYDSTVLLTGPTGTGKSMIAQVIHEQSPRRERPMLALNCGALPDSLLEAELFGYAAGSFTGAARGGKPGLVEAADGGTLFLDEIDALPLDIQVKLLTFLDTQSFIRVGDTRLRQVDVRLVAATNCRLDERVAAGRFREDLYFRLNVVPLDLPALAARPQDIPALVQHMLGRLNQRYGHRRGISADALDLLCRHDYPGNVRELQNLLERSYVLCDSDSIQPDDLPEPVRGGLRDERMHLAGPGDRLEDVLREAERRLLEHACHRHRRQVDIARAIGVSQATVARLLKRHGLRASGA